MRLLKSYSGKVVLLIGFVFALSFGEKIVDVAKGESTCVCAYDGFGYYLYLPAVFDEGTINPNQQWAQELQNAYCDSLGAYQIVTYKNGADLNVYHMGMAFVYIPSYLIAETVARIAGYPTDGFSTPYHILFLLNALLFTFLGLLYLRKLLLLFFDERIAALTILMLYLASNLFVTFKIQYDLQHLYLFALNSIFLYHLFKYQKNKEGKNILYAAIILGLTVCIRPTQVLWGIIPLLVLLKEHSFSATFWKRILLFPAFGLLWNIPQLIYWKMLGGELFILNLHVEDIVLADPHVSDFLFSYKKGWLLYSPIFLALVFGFVQLYRYQKRLFWACFVFIALYIYVMCSWENWWYASSFGSRVMVDTYPLLAIVLAFFIKGLKKSWMRVAGVTFVIGCIALNLFQSTQLIKGYLHNELMTKQHYWYIFGKLHIDDYHTKHLEIDRADITWINRARELPSDQYNFVVKRVFDLEQPMTSEPLKALTLGRFTLYDKVNTDETLFEATITSQTSDSTKSVQLRMEVVSPYNCYSWNNFEISQGQPEGKFTTQTFKYNLPRIHHSGDEMQLYLYTTDDVEISIKDFTITGYSLKRK